MRPFPWTTWVRRDESHVIGGGWSFDRIVTRIYPVSRSVSPARAYTRTVLTAADALDRPARKILVAGVTGAGKTTLARRIGQTLAVPHTEIDSLYHGPNWTPREALDGHAAQRVPPHPIAE
jgi:hypothetical protein